MLGYIRFPDHQVTKVKFCSKSIYKINYFAHLGIDLINKFNISFIVYLLVQTLFYLLIHIFHFITILLFSVHHLNVIEIKVNLW
jgi:hypothetical protein